MRGKPLWAGFAAALTAALVGCHHDRFGLAYKPKEEAVLPADEPRFNNPPSAPYKKRLPKGGDEKTLMGRDKMMGGGGGPMSPGF
jgi:hypothetical protein